MVISHKYKYLFIEVPHTASTAVSAELCENYAGEKILNKHANYRQFLRMASPEEKNYFIFCGLRNPMDEAVSHYFKFRTNHRNRYTNPQKRKENSLGGVDTNTVDFFNWVQNDNPDFPAFLRRLHRLPYDNQICIVQHRVDHIIRFENLQSDFSELLKRLGIEQKRPIPSTNKTQKKDGNSFLDYYTPETYEYAKRIFGPFMQKWDYNFPPEWGHVNIPWWSQTEFNILSVFRRFYWGYIRTNSSTGIRNFGNKVKGMLKSKYT